MRRPLHVGVAELRRRPGTQREVEVDVEVPGLELSTARVPDGAELHVELVLESLPDGVTATGTIQVPWAAECRRCLRQIDGTAVAQVREVFEARPVEGETYPLEGDHIDLEPMVREAALLALPLAPLCGEDCSGPAPDAFPTGSEVTDDHDGPAGDPRWAALDALRFGDEE